MATINEIVEARETAGQEYATAVAALKDGLYRPLGI